MANNINQLSHKDHWMKFTAAMLLVVLAPWRKHTAQRRMPSPPPLRSKIFRVRGSQRG